MNNVLRLERAIRLASPGARTLPRISLPLRTLRAASINAAIHRGIRRSLRAGPDAARRTARRSTSADDGASSRETLAPRDLGRRDRSARDQGRLQLSQRAPARLSEREPKSPRLLKGRKRGRWVQDDDVPVPSGRSKDFAEMSSVRRTSGSSRKQTGLVVRQPREIEHDKSSRTIAMRPAAEVSRDSTSRSLSAASLTSNLPARKKREPISIPYTTAASEFLYGTSVVEAALRSTRETRRKLYKLYIYIGEGREDGNKDAAFGHLAKKMGLPVVRVQGVDWLRVMDKMSGGRPHNGYVLEASPLPRLPLTSLGEVTTVDGVPGFHVNLDYQSREEAMVNGTSNFVKLPRHHKNRKPFVLLLDSILDPGNLGGIIRTASFLGVTAVAISARNSASFTPVVLKASAGASENITIFTVNKPAGFVTDSRAAGWKVFAAVAPSGENEPGVQALTTNNLEDPLSEDPCLLMLGSEGEGLRKNLRAKANVALSIPGSVDKNSVDSLNVSVAAGILCTAFLRKPAPPPAPKPAKLAKPAKQGDLF